MGMFPEQTYTYIAHMCMYRNVYSVYIYIHICDGIYPRDLKFTLGYETNSVQDTDLSERKLFPCDFSLVIQLCMQRERERGSVCR